MGEPDLDSTILPHAADPKSHKKTPIFTPFLLLEAWITQALVREMGHLFAHFWYCNLDLSFNE